MGSSGKCHGPVFIMSLESLKNYSKSQLRKFLTSKDTLKVTIEKNFHCIRLLSSCWKEAPYICRQFEKLQALLGRSSVFKYNSVINLAAILLPS